MEVTVTNELVERQPIPFDVPELQIRPNQPQDDEVSFLWQPGLLLAELVYRPGNGLRFLVRETDNTLREQPAVQGYAPVRWIGEYARAKLIRLPSKAEPYESLEQLAERVRGFIHKYFECGPLFESVAVLYVMHSWLYEQFHAVPYLRFVGPPATGKTRGTETIGALCYHPLVIAGSITSAPMFRLLEVTGGTVLVDECDLRDSQIGADITRVLCCGYQKGLSVSRMRETEHHQWVPGLHTVFGPKIINGRKRFQDEAVETRCLSYTPSVSTRHDIPVQLPRAFDIEALQIQNQLLAFRFDNLDSVEPNTEYITGVGRRLNQIIQPLLTVAGLFTTPFKNRYRSDLLQFARQTDSQAREISKESVEAALVRSLAGFDHAGIQPTCKGVRDDVMARECENAKEWGTWLTPKKVSQIVRDLGFSTRHTELGSIVLADPKRLHAVADRYGVTYQTDDATVSHFNRQPN